MNVNEYELDGYKITEYRDDNNDLKAKVEELIYAEDDLEIVDYIPQEDIRKRTLLNTEYLVVMSELQNGF